MKAPVVVALALLVTSGGTGRPAASAEIESISTSATPTTDLVAVATHTAVRLNPPAASNEQALSFGTGLHARPFAVEGLSDCDEMSFYRQQWGLPASFDALGWRESGCRNEDNVRTACCVGYWQLYVATFVRDVRAAPRLGDECSVYSSTDVDSDTPVDKQRQACAAAVVYSIQGFGAWSL
jgi:hypothetical protein